MSEEKNIQKENIEEENSKPETGIENISQEQIIKQPQSQEPGSSENNDQVNEPFVKEEIVEQQRNDMEVHHHPDLHHNPKRWREYLLEFLMIFLAVTLGFFAESYREYAAEKSRAAQYARSLVHDLEKDTAMAQIDIENINFLNSKIDSLSNFLRGKKIDNIANMQLFAYTHFVCLYRPYSWSRATLEQIKSSGSLRYFDNDSIIMRISAYDAFTKHLDADFNGDEERSNKVGEKRNLIVDLSYDLEDSLAFRLDPDSTMKLISEEIKTKRGDLLLLTHNMNDIKNLLNDYIIIKRHFINRSGELSKLTSDAEKLISMLREEYNFE